MVLGKEFGYRGLDELISDVRKDAETCPENAMVGRMKYIERG